MTAVAYADEGVVKRLADETIDKTSDETIGKTMHLSTHLFVIKIANSVRCYAFHYGENMIALPHHGNAG